MPSILWRLTHLRGPELHQYGLLLCLLVNALLLQEPPVGVKPRARTWVLIETRWSQKLPQSLLKAVGCPLLLCPVDKQSEREWVTEKKCKQLGSIWTHYCAQEVGRDIISGMTGLTGGGVHYYCSWLTFLCRMGGTNAAVNKERQGPRKLGVSS